MNARQFRVMVTSGSNQKMILGFLKKKHSTRDGMFLKRETTTRKRTVTKKRKNIWRFFTEWMSKLKFSEVISDINILLRVLI